MRKFLAIAVASILLVLGMAVTASAADYVYYETDFSDPSELDKYTQYQGEWDIVDGKLMMVGLGDFDSFEHAGFILYDGEDGVNNLDNYIFEADVTNLQTQQGLLVRCDLDYALAGAGNTEAFYGYWAYTSYDGTTPVLGFSNTLGVWGGIIDGTNLGAFFAPGANLRVKVTVEGENITYQINDLDSGSELYNVTVAHTTWGHGTFGFRVYIMKNGLTNLMAIGYDNVKVTATGACGDWLAAGKSLKDYKTGNSSAVVAEKKEAIEVNVPDVVQVDTSKLDLTKTEYVFYENDFSDAATMADFEEYDGDWEIRDGALWYKEPKAGYDVNSATSFLLYSGNHDANLLTDYAVDVDIVNVQTQAGVITRADLSQADTDNPGNSFYGYVSYVSNDGTLAALAYINEEGGWAGTHFASENPVTAPGGTYHLNVRHFDGLITYTVSDMDGNVLFTNSVADAEWAAGTFGFRMRKNYEELVNVGVCSWDNLKVTVYGEQAVLLNAGYHPNAEIVGDGEIIVTEPVVTTAEPVVTTAEPVVTTAEPVVTTDEPVVTTDEPVVTTTAAPVGGTTADSAVTTDEPVVTTAEPVVTTAEPVVTTAEPVVTTAEPAVTTDEPAVTTTAADPVDQDGGANVALIVGIIVAVVVVAAIVVVVLKKKKN